MYLVVQLEHALKCASEGMKKNEIAQEHYAGPEDAPNDDLMGDNYIDEVD